LSIHIMLMYGFNLGTVYMCVEVVNIL